MKLLIYSTVALSVWVVLWSLGAKSFDAFMVAILIMLWAVAHHMIGPHLPGKRPS